MYTLQIFNDYILKHVHLKIFSKHAVVFARSFAFAVVFHLAFYFHKCVGNEIVFWKRIIADIILS